MKKSFAFIFTLFLGSVLLVSCGAPRVENTAVPQSTTQAVTADNIIQYTVVRHDNLWEIASKASIYGDPFQWPLIFKSNRDKIQDPDLIYPDQDFQINKSVSAEEVQAARKLASETGPYKKHTKPRKVLPIDYF